MVRRLPDLDLLKLGDLNNTIWTEEMVLSLPQCLRELNLSGTEMSSSHLKSLPPNLHTLDYGQRQLHDERQWNTEYTWRGEDFWMLPRSITGLYLYNADFVEDTHMAMLPPRLLVFLSIRASKLTEKALLYLPTHCFLHGSGYAPKSRQASIIDRLEALPLEDPDPRVLGRPFNWN